MSVPLGADRTLVLDLEDVGHASWRQPKNRPSCSARPMNGPHGLGDVARGDVDGEGDEVAGQGQQDLLGDGDAGLVLGLGGRGAEVGRDHDRGQLEEGRLGGGLLGEHVEAGARDPAAARWPRPAPPRRRCRPGPC